MASRVTRDHHRWTRDIESPQNTEINVTGNLTADVSGDIILDAGSGITHFYDAGDTDDAFKITVAEGTGATTLETVSAGADGNLTIKADGLMSILASGQVEFKGVGVGFDRLLAADAADVEIDFTTGNKAHLDMTGGSISGTLTLKFPQTSGNFVLVVEQDGSTRTIAAYATKDAAGNAGDNDGGTGGAVRWTGGSVPDLTDGGNKRDILSFYWDADEEVCYGVASLNF